MLRATSIAASQDYAPPRRDTIMSSDEDEGQLMASFKKGEGHKAAPPKGAERPAFSRGDHVSENASGSEGITLQSEAPMKRRALCVRVKPIARKDEYVYYEPKDEVEGIIREYSKKGDLIYEVRLFGDRTKKVTFEQLLELPGGPEALSKFQPEEDDQASQSEQDDMQLRQRGQKAKRDGYVDFNAIQLSSSEIEDDDDDGFVSRSLQPRRRRLRAQVQHANDSGRSSRTRSRGGDILGRSSSEEEQVFKASHKKRRGRPRKQVLEATRRSSRQQMPARGYDDEDDEDEDDDEDDTSDSNILRSDVLPGRKRKRQSQHFQKPEKAQRFGVRQSDRSTRATNNMTETGENDVYRSDSEPKAAAPRLTQVREVFPTLPRSDLFRARHAEGCEVCYSGPNVAPLIYCQGCSLAYHKNCIGNRSTRDHLVTKVGNETFVLQCKRCINFYQKKDAIAPDLARCQDCAQHGVSCRPFRRRKTTQQEMKDREDNGGQDPIVDVDPELVNNAHNVMFRCTKCSRAWHFHHLPPLDQYAMDINRDDKDMADERFREYSRRWMCKDCTDTDSKKVSGLIAWRPSDVETYRPGTPCDMINEDDKQYLVKWENESYFQAAWFSGAWTWGVTAPVMRKAFFKREDGPKMRTEDAIPEEYLRIDIVLSVKYTSIVDVHTEEIDKARIKEVDKALIKYKGLGYEDAVWEKVPTPEDGDRWLDFVTAYNDWVAGRYVRYPKQGPLKIRIEKVRNQPFAKLEKEKQPDNLVGGELMKYQIEGLNWLYYQWYSQKNGILADEMGLGKTIQLIAYMATMVQEHNCFPFLIVVPNSTAANWRREIKQWVPSLRVVAYFGSSQAREMAYKYEMYPEGTKELRCHIVVTSYEAAADDSCRRMFRSVSWAGLIVDEGQRLKNDKSQLYTALSAIRAPFRVLMTGTPLQNNARELFNLLHFLDESIDAAQLEEKYAEMTSENVKELHDQIRPFILRRTKAQVLTFLPPLGQVILPISMSHLQKQLYKSILSKRPELLKALFTSDKSLKQQERANLSNILMQLRKCLCHPFVYSREIEERTDIAAVSHRNLVEASAKLSLLEVLLPKLKERGHRVLIFSQFLDMLNIVEDFLDGMQMAYQRLDGQMGSLEKQKRIDQFNAPDSPLFAFLLSTRAGGVGINLATADTVIILDPDWNPHQDLQAIARAHRIGQKKKVLCFQLMTRASVEEKIIQMGRKKMALDHVVVEQLDADDIEDHDVESILKFGAAELFKDDNADQDIRYDDASIEKLIDRSQIEDTKTAVDDDSAEAQFSFARVWANDKGALQTELETVEEEIAPDPGVWDKILKERQAIAAAEAIARAEAMGRGRRARGNVDYVTDKDNADAGSVAAEDALEDAIARPSPIKKPSRRKRAGSESDTDFQADTEEESEPEPAAVESVDVEKDLNADRRRSTTTTVNSTIHKQNSAGALNKVSSTTTHDSSVLVTVKHTSKRHVLPPVVTGKNPRAEASNGKEPPVKPSNVKASPSKPSPVAASPPEPPSGKESSQPAPPETIDLPSPKSRSNPSSAVKPFKRAQLPVRNPMASTYGNHGIHICPACFKQHPQGACELKVAGVEHCNLCGLAHFGHGRTCPHIRSETQVRAMLAALKNSPEDPRIKEQAMKYLRGVKGAIVQYKKKQQEKIAAQNGAPPPEPMPRGPNKGIKHASYAPGAANGASVYHHEPPQREVSGWYKGSEPVNGASGRSGMQLTPVEQQRMVQMQAHGELDEHEMEHALRGYLGH